MSRPQQPRILLIDIETFPILAHVWELYEANALNVEVHSIICCFSAKWLGGEQITRALTDYKGYRPGTEDDSRLVREMRDLLDEADMVVAHNGKRFDFKRVNSRIIKHGMAPPSPYKKIDTLEAARREFGFPSNKLNDLGKYLDLGEKIHTGGFRLWQRCMAGDPAAWRQMKRYNAQDTRLLEKLYLRFLPWISNHPNIAIYSNGTACPKCGAEALQSRGLLRLSTTVYQRYQCQSCGGWSRSPKSEKGTKPMVNA